MKRTVRLVTLLLAMFMLLSASLISCDDPAVPSETNTDSGTSAPSETTADDNPSTPKPSVLKAWTGDYSRISHRKAIDEYEKNYSPLTVTNKSEASDIRIQLETPVDSHRISMVAHVGDNYMEMDAYIDLWVFSSYDEATGTLSFDASWWYDESDWVHEYETWSFAIRTNHQDETTWYYVRVNFSGFGE